MACFPTSGAMRLRQIWGTRHYHCSGRVEFVASHPFHKEREMDGARSFLTPSEKML
jgi:hypothetical protein